MATAARASDVLSAEAVTIPLNGKKFPTNIIDAMQVVEAIKDQPCYFVNADQLGHKLNEPAQAFLDFLPAATGKTILEVFLKIAERCFPANSLHRNPRQDFILQQLLLSFLAWGGRHPIPTARFVIAKTDGCYEATVIAKHVFSPENKFVGTLCYAYLEGISARTYKSNVQCDTLVFPLPEDIAEDLPRPYKWLYKPLSFLLGLVLHWFEPNDFLLEKNLPQESAASMVNSATSASGLSVTKSLPSFTNLHEVETYPAFAQFRQEFHQVLKMMHQIEDPVERVKALKLLDSFAESTREIVQDEIKALAFPGQSPSGTVRLNEVLSPDENRAYIKAAIGKGSEFQKLFRLSDEERDALREQKHGETFVEAHATKPATSRRR